MKKLMMAFMAVMLVGCGGVATVDKVDEKGHNPAPEQVVDADCIPAIVIDTTLVTVKDTL